jgi:protoporphyrinogen oxidase
MSQLNIDDDLYSFLYLIEVWCGGSVKKITSSFLTSGIFGDYNGPHYLFKNGAKTLIESIINSAKESYYDRIKYNQVVTDIIYNDYYVEVRTQDGNIYYCNQVCITVPPKPLKSINFSPPLDNKRLGILS